jgi:hypothetical protein
VNSGSALRSPSRVCGGVIQPKADTQPPYLAVLDKEAHRAV